MNRHSLAYGRENLPDKLRVIANALLNGAVYQRSKGRNVPEELCLGEQTENPADAEPHRERRAPALPFVDADPWNLVLQCELDHRRLSSIQC